MSIYLSIHYRFIIYDFLIFQSIFNIDLMKTTEE